MENQVWDQIPEDSVIGKTVKNLEKRNLKVVIVNSGQEALKKIKDIIPDGAEVMTGASETLKQIGFTDILESGKHPWKNLKGEIVAEKDPQKQMELRRRSVTAEYFLGSVHAVAETGEVVVASNTGSQLPAYVFSSPHVIWVVGAQKIASDFDSAMRRLKEYVFPLEDARMKSTGAPGSAFGKIVTFEREFFPGRITMILVKEKLGF